MSKKLLLICIVLVMAVSTIAAAPAPALKVPVPIAPNGGTWDLSNRDPKFTWFGVSGATGYVVALQCGTTATRYSSTTKTSLTMGAPIGHGTGKIITCKWQVWATQKGVKGTPSAWKTFKYKDNYRG